MQLKKKFIQNINFEIYYNNNSNSNENLDNDYSKKYQLRNNDGRRNNTNSSKRRVSAYNTPKPRKIITIKKIKLIN